MDKTKRIIKSGIFFSAVLIASSTLAFNFNKQNNTAPEPVELNINENSFQCITDMTPIRDFFVDNLIEGQLEGTIAAANSENGAVYPPGSVVQLVPGEVMVKHHKGYNDVTNDWEFFELTVSNRGTQIRKRGVEDVVNRFGGNCFDCHVKAEPQWDLICEKNHGCDPLPLNTAAIKAIQNSDPRCRTDPVN